MDPDRADCQPNIARLLSPIPPSSDIPESAKLPIIPSGSEMVSTASSSIAEPGAINKSRKGDKKGGTHKDVPPVANYPNYSIIPSAEVNGKWKVAKNVGAPQFLPQTAHEISRGSWTFGAQRINF